MTCAARIAATAAALALGACAGGGKGGWVELETESPAGGDMIQISGTVRNLDLEGGLFVIRDADGTQYNPTNLPESFRVDGMPVEAEARRRDDMASIGMVGPLVELLRIREGSGGTAAAPDPASGSQPADLAGSKWRLEDLAGRGVVDDAQATLEFGTDGNASGHGSCNRFRGPVRIAGDSISFGALVATRMFCGEAVTGQENAYMAALADVTRYEVENSSLYLYAAGLPAPLRFIRE